LSLECMLKDEAVLIISHDIVGQQMAGPGIRYRELARVLAQHFPVVLAVPSETDLLLAGVELCVYQPGEWDSLKSVVAHSKAILLCGDVLAWFPQLAQTDIPIIMDGYDPHTLETLALFAAAPDQAQRHQDRERILQQQCEVGDFFICASERQRDWWLGLLEATGRVNVATYNDDPSLRKLIDVVPFGLPAAPPRHTQPVLKGVWPGIGTADKVVLWGGGLWQWLDPLTATRAIARVREYRDDVRLVFPGTRHPNPAVPVMPMVDQAKELAVGLGLLDKYVFFGDWVAYAEWPNYLLEADVGLSLHFDTLETRMTFRTRMLDYVWAGLPMVVTGGDITSEMVTQFGLGQVVGYKAVTQVTSAILDVLERSPIEFEQCFAAIRSQLTWEKSAEALIEFCKHPYRAADHVRGSQLPEIAEVPDVMVQQAAVMTQRAAEIARLQVLVAGYERRFWTLWKENVDLRDLSLDLSNTLRLQEAEAAQMQHLRVRFEKAQRYFDEYLQTMKSEIKTLTVHKRNLESRLLALETHVGDIKSSMGWIVAQKLQRVRAFFFPPGSSRDQWLDSFFEVVRVQRLVGGIAFLLQEIKTRLFVEHSPTCISDDVDTVADVVMDPYTRWIIEHEPDESELMQQRETSQHFTLRPLISFVVPVYDPSPKILIEMLASVSVQTYGHWELCLVNGGSGPQIKTILDEWALKDSRVFVKHLEHNLGISGNSNEALALAQGEFVALLDHDDVIAPNMLYEVVRLLNHNPQADVIYFDEDKIHKDEFVRSTPFFKPDWSLHLLLSANYLTHAVIRRALVLAVGVFDSAMDGAQDWDLIFRCTEKTDQIFHIPKILYHWRMSKHSASRGVEIAKPWAFEAQVRAVQSHLDRIDIVAETTLSAGVIRIVYPHSSRKVSIIIPTKNKVSLLLVCLSSLLELTAYSNYEIILVDNGSDDPATLHYYKCLAGESRVKIISNPTPFNYSAANNLGVTYATGDIFLFLNNDTQILESHWLDVALCLRAIAAHYAVIYTPFARLHHLEGASRGAFVPPSDIVRTTAQMWPYIQFGDSYFNPNLSYAQQMPRLVFADEPDIEARFINALVNLGLVQTLERGRLANFSKKMAGYIKPYVKSTVSHNSNLSPTLKLMIVTYDLSLSDASIALAMLTQYLVKTGTKVTVYSSKSGAMLEHYVQLGVAVYVEPKLFEDALAASEIVVQYDAVIINTIMSWMFVHAASAFSVPSLWWIHESVCDFDLTSQSSLVASALNETRAVVFVTQTVANVYRSLLSYDDYIIMPYGVEIKDVLLEQSLLVKPGNKFCIIHSGGIEFRKGQDVLVDAVLALPDDIKQNIVVYFLGPILDKSFYAELQRCTVQEDCVKFMGEVPDALFLEYLKIADVFVLTSRDEVLPITLLTAMGYAKPIITTDVGGITEIIEHRQHGLLVPSVDIDALRKSLVKLINNRDLAEQLGDAAYNRFKERFALPHIGQAMLDVLHQICV